MKKIAGYLGLIVALLVMVTAVFTYLTPHLGWRVPNLGLITSFLETLPGFLLGLIVPTLLFIILYAKIIWRLLHEDKTQNLSEITNR